MSEIKVNKISPRTACGTVTLGDSGDTFTIPSGATITNSGTQTGFGRTGTVDWVTTVKVTGDSPITGVTGKGYFLNTTAGTITVNLPAGVAGSILAFKDYAGTWDTNNVTVTPNGSEKVGGIAGSATLSTERQSVTLIYIDSTQGWLDIHDSTSAVTGPLYVTATGGTPCAGATSGDYKIHTFTGPGTLTVSCAGNAGGSNTVDYMVIAGGAGGGGEYGGGGGAGGYRESVPSPAAWTGSPIAFSGNARPVTATPYTITVGGGGAGGSGGCVQGSDGNDSTFSDITSGKGGGGGSECCAGTIPSKRHGRDGGSGGGTSYYSPGPTAATVGAGNVPDVTPDQGFPGGLAITPGTAGHASGGGGGSGAVGVAAPSAPVAGAGGAGVISCISATPTQRGGGGGGGGGGGPQPYTPGAGGAGGGGAGATDPGGAGTNGQDNTGGGGGGANNSGPSVGGTGGSGLVVLRYKFQ